MGKAGAGNLTGNPIPTIGKSGPDFPKKTKMLATISIMELCIESGNATCHPHKTRIDMPIICGITNSPKNVEASKVGGIMANTGAVVC